MTVQTSSISRSKYFACVAVALVLFIFVPRALASFKPFGPPAAGASTGMAAVTAGQTAGHPSTGSALDGKAESASRPLIFYTDITSGPNEGGEGNNGTYLTIFGAHFGATQESSKVTINGQAVAQYLLWSDGKIGVQAGHVSSGPIVVFVGGSESNSDQMFTVRRGHIYYIGPAVDNSNASCKGGTYERPWGLTDFASKSEAAYTRTMRTPTAYYECLSFGDSLVFLDGVSYPYFDGRGWHASLTPSKTGANESHFLTFLARPGAHVQLGGTGWAMAPVRDTSDGFNVFSGLTLTGSGLNGGAYFNASGYAQNDRVVGNEITCPDCLGPAGAVMAGNGFVMYGNTVDQVSTLDRGGSNKTYHAIYVGGNNIEIAWNRILNTLAYNGIQINHDKSSGFYNQSYHDNDIADVNGSGINLSTIDPSTGYIKVYNNVIHHVGVAQAADSPGPHSCLAIKGYGSATGTGTVEIYNNTMYDCSSYLNTNPSDNSSCAVLVLGNQLNVTTNLTNNIVYQPAYAGTSKQNVYSCGGGALGTLSGSHNLWYSERAPARTAPALSYGVIADPLFASKDNFHLKRRSPAIGAGISVGDQKRDHDGTLRTSPPAIGAFQ